MKYKITYIDSKGKRSKQIVNWDFTLDELVKTYRQEGNTILDIEETKDLEISSLRKNQISEKKLSLFLTELSILLNAGVGLKDSISILYGQEKDKNMKKALKSITIDLGQGYTLSKSIERSNYFPKIIASVTYAGEMSSNLPETFKLMAEFYENELKLKENFRNALYYPVILIIVTIFVAILISNFVLPNFLSLFEAFGSEELPALTLNMIRFSEFINKNKFLIFMVISISYLIFMRLLKKEKIKLVFSKSILKMPILGSYLTRLETQRFSAIMLLLNKSGIEILENIKISANTISNTFMKSKLLLVDSYIVKGNTITNSFEKLGLFPEMFLNLIAIGEKSSSFNEVLEVAYTYYKNINESSNKKISALFEPVIIILVSLIVGTVVMSIALPMFSIINII